MGNIVTPDKQTRTRGNLHNCQQNADFPTDAQTSELPPGTVYECTEQHNGKRCGRRWKLIPPVAAEWRAVRVIVRKKQPAGSTAAA